MMSTEPRLNLFNKDLGLDLLINKKKIGSDGGSVASFGRSGGSGSLVDLNSDAGSVKSINIQPSFVDVREHMQPPPSRPQQTFNNFGGSPFGENMNNGQYSDDYDGSSYKDDESGGSELTAEEQYNNNNQYNPRYQNQNQMTDEEILNAKREILYQFERLERKGMQLPKKFTMASNLEEMKLELDRLRRDRDVDQSVKFQRKVMMTVVTGMELMNNKFDPVGARLDGWSESINDNIDDYDEVFEELHDKYKGKAKMAPEFKLMFMLGGSAFMFHMTNTMFKTQMPGMEEVLKRNPDLMRQFAAATANTMQQNTAESNPMMSGLSGMFSNMFGYGGAQQQQQQPPHQPPMQQQRTNMKGPSNVDDILRELERESMNDRVEMMSTVTQSDLSELGDDASINGLLMNNKRGKGKRGITLDI
jgi:Family of unknown function (DUF5767)